MYIDSCLRWVNGYIANNRNKVEVSNELLHILNKIIIDNGDVHPVLCDWACEVQLLGYTDVISWSCEETVTVLFP